MHKYKYFTNLDEEEHWLNDMARKGYRFTKKTSMGYKFEAGQSEDATIKMDYRSFKKQSDFQDYCALFEDSGWEHVSGTRSSGYQYFKKVGIEGNEDIFSDIDSKVGRYKRLSNMWASVASSYIPLLVVLIVTDVIQLGQWLDPKSLYYTPGLWDLDGAAFWRAFLFESPFVLFRNFLWLIFPVTILLYVYFSIMANRQYKKVKVDHIMG